MLINPSFFIVDITVPNVGNAAILERLNSFINQYEQECLVNILGYDLYKSYKADATTPRMVDLISGAEYTDYYGNLKKWNGLVQTVVEPVVYSAGPPEVQAVVGQYKSLIANYIYYFFQQQSMTQTTGISTAAMKSEAGVSVSPADKMIYAWNSFSQDVANMVSFLRSKSDVYPEFTEWVAICALDSNRQNNNFGI